MCPSLSCLLHLNDEEDNSRTSNSRLVEIFKPIGTFKSGILTCPSQAGSELTVTGIDDHGTLIFTSRCYRASVIVRDDVETTVNFNLNKLDLNRIKNVKIVYTTLYS